MADGEFLDEQSEEVEDGFVELIALIESLQKTHRGIKRDLQRQAVGRRRGNTEE